MRLKPARSVLAALGVVAVVASIAVTAAPAFASSGAVDYFLDDVNLAANGGVGKAYPIFTLEDGTLSNVKLSIDLSHLDGIATVSFPDASTHCSVTGDTATCELPQERSIRRRMPVPPRRRDRESEKDEPTAFRVDRRYLPQQRCRRTTTWRSRSNRTAALPDRG